MSVEEEIHTILTMALAPSALEVINESHKHAGHQGSPGTGESHFRVIVSSDRFDGKSRLERHRMVNDALGDLLAGRIHALAIRASAPGDGA